MSSFRLDSAVAADAAAVTDVVVALESSLYGQSGFSQADLEDAWSGLDLEKNARVGSYRQSASEVWLLIVNDLFLGPGEVCVHLDELAKFAKSDRDT